MLLKEYLINFKKNNKFPNSIIIKPIHCCDYKKITNDYLKALTCNNNDYYCNQCGLCKRINNDVYVDLFYLDFNQEKIEREEIENIQSIFSQSASELSGKKLYVLKNIEKANKQIVNSLLKFIEDNPKDTFCLIITNNENRIISTIKSRSYLIKIDDSVDYSQIEGDDDYKSTIINIFNDFNEFRILNEKINLYEKYDLAKTCIDAKQQIDISRASKMLVDLDRNEYLIVLRMIEDLVSDYEKKFKISEIINNLHLNISLKNSTIILFQILKG